MYRRVFLSGTLNVILSDYRRFCYSVGKAEVPYASLGVPPVPLGVGMPH